MDTYYIIGFVYIYSMITSMRVQQLNGLVWTYCCHGQKIVLYMYVYTIWLFNIAMENGPFIDGLPIKNDGSFHGYVK